MLRVQDYGHEEVKAKWARDPRMYNIMTKNFVSDDQGHVCGVKTVCVEWTQDAAGYATCYDSNTLCTPA